LFILLHYPFQKKEIKISIIIKALQIPGGQFPSFGGVRGG